MRSRAKYWALLLFSWLVLPVLTFFAIELGLRQFWPNPYLRSNSHAAYTRFHPPRLLAYAAIRDQLYRGQHRVRIYVDSDMALSAGTDPKIADSICIGGSTTEAALVPEGRRWPDLLDPPARNFGVSGNNSIDGYYNLKYLLEVADKKPDHAFIMFAVNDLKAFLTKGAQSFSLATRRQPTINALAQIDHADQHLLLNLRVRDSSLFSFLRYYTNNLVGRDFFRGYSEQHRAQASLPVVTAAEFGNIMTELRDEFLPRRKDVYAEMDQLARKHGVTLSFIAQPHAYYRSYHPYRKDLRLTPRWRNKRMSIGQAAEIVDAINTQTRALAQAFGHEYIDMPSCFAQHRQEHLFYDSVHYTLEGSQRFAKCVNDLHQRKMPH